MVGIAFAALNAEVVKFNYLIGKTEIRLAWLLLFSFIIGTVLTMVLLGVSVIKLKAKNKWLEGKIKRAQEA